MRGVARGDTAAKGKRRRAEHRRRAAGEQEGWRNGLGKLLGGKKGVISVNPGSFLAPGEDGGRTAGP